MEQAMSETNADQRAFWSDAAGPKWVALQEQMDELLQPVLTGMWDRAQLQPTETVLDVGCGTGTSCLQAADTVGPQGQIIGADISHTMTELARLRIASHPNITVLLADVADHPFKAAQFDRVVSRFGVMFFTDPVAAFKNIRRAMKPGAACFFAAWGSTTNNPYFTVAAQVAKSVLGSPPKKDPDGPGPFAFRDPERLRGILQASGFDSIACDTASVVLDGGQDKARLAHSMCQIGPAEAALSYFQAKEAEASALNLELRRALADFDTPQGIRIPAEIHFFSARKPY